MYSAIKSKMKANTTIELSATARFASFSHLLAG